MLCYSAIALRLSGRFLNSYIPEVSEEVRCPKKNVHIDRVG